jgi:hypothetical protein
VFREFILANVRVYGCSDDDMGEIRVWIRGGEEERALGCGAIIITTNDALYDGRSPIDPNARSPKMDSSRT